MILDLCGGTGSWSLPYLQAGYKVLIIDPLVNTTVEDFVARLKNGYELEEPVKGVLAAPPCTEFAASGARWWSSKDISLVTSAMETVYACYEIVQITRPNWWCLENPVGRLSACCPFLGDYVFSFDPWQYGDPYTKKTCLWGQFNIPPPEYNKKPPLIWSKAHKLSGKEKTKRALTPPGFARAFFRSNP